MSKFQKFMVGVLLAICAAGPCLIVAELRLEFAKQAKAVADQTKTNEANRLQRDKQLQELGKLVDERTRDRWTKSDHEKWAKEFEAKHSQ